MGKSSRKGEKGSVHITAKYEPLSQDPNDNEEEDDVLFIQNGDPMKQQNGHTDAGSPNKTGDLEADLCLEKAKVSRKKPQSEVQVRVMKYGLLTKTRLAFIALTVILCLGFALLFTLISHSHGEKKLGAWRYNLEDYGTESCAAPVDVDGDGKDDILLGIVPASKMCQYGDQIFPCVGEVLAVRGYDGKELWRMKVKTPPFELNCGNIDINQDGRPDCLAAGRLASITAFDPYEGKVLWTGDKSVLHKAYNVYNPLIVSDLTKDGVPEVVLAHGGDPKYEPEQHNRAAGRIILLDGVTGKSLTRGRYLELPDSRETYMTPVLHTLKDNTQYIIVGSGGETVNGSMFVISLSDLYRYIKPDSVGQEVPNRPGYDEPMWPHLKKHKNGFKEIYSGKTKGVLVPPVLVDINKDGTKDILILSFEGTIVLLDGEKMKMLWQTTDFYGWESYSTPAPGYFNDDDTLDFMITFNKGLWPEYDGCKVVILDGKSGNMLWSLNLTQPDFTSSLVIKTEEENRDAFVFKLSRSGEEATRDSSTQKSKRDAGYYGRRRPVNNDGSSWPSRNQLDYEQPEYGNSDYNSYYGNLEKYPYANAIDNEGDYTQYNGQPGNSVDNPNYKDADDDDDDDDDDHDEDSGPPVDSDECSHPQGSTELYIVDRSTLSAPVHILTIPTVKYWYNMSNEIRIEMRKSVAIANVSKSRNDSPRNKRHGHKTELVDDLNIDGVVEMCVVLKESGVSTGALGDFDGDGHLDAIVPADGEGDISDPFGHTVKQFASLSLVKTNIEHVMRHKYEQRKLDIYVDESMKNLKNVKPLKDVKFKKTKYQKWFRYLGSKCDSIVDSS